MRRFLLACFTSVVALFVGAAAFAVPQAHAIGDYSIDELSTQVTVQTDASVHVIERQTLTFSDHNAGLVWYLHAPEDGESVRITSVRVVPVDNGGTLLGDWTRLQMVDSNPRAQGRDPGDTAAAELRTTKTQPWYSFNIGDGMMRCYFPIGKVADKAADKMKQDANAKSDAEGDENSGTGDADGPGEESEAVEAVDNDFHTYLVETDYTVAHRMRVFRDVGELYWRYAHDSLPADAYNVSLQVVLPVPPETDSAATRENVRAWGHGPDGGTFSASDDGAVTYEVDKVSQGNYAEAHVIFPASWLGNASSGANRFSELRGPSAIAEESEWVDVGLREANWDNTVRALFLTFTLIVMLAGAVSVLRHGRSPRSRRALVRVAATLGITAAGANLFFREPLTTIMLVVLAIVVLAVALVLPMHEEPDDELAEAEALASLEPPDTTDSADNTEEPQS